MEVGYITKVHVALLSQSRREAARRFVSVSNFNSTIRRVQVPLQIYRCVQLYSVLFYSALTRGALCRKQTCTVTVIHYNSRTTVIVGRTSAAVIDR